MFFPSKPRGVGPGNGSSPHTATPAQQQAPLLAAGRDMDAQKESTRTPLSLLPLMLSPHSLLWFLQAPTVVSKFNKAFIFPPPPPQLVILEIALSEDKVQRWHRSTSLGSSSKVHISLQAGCPSPHFLRTKQLKLSPSPTLLTLSSCCSRGQECKQSLIGKMGRGTWIFLPFVRTAHP